MATQQPIFTRNFYGGLNRFVMNDWSQAASAVRENSQGIAHAQRSAFAGQVVSVGLCQIVSATAIAGAGYRWTYSVKLWHPPPLTGAGITVAATDDRFTYASCINLREYHNTPTLVDCVTVAALPADQFGPVGYVFQGGAWTLPEGGGNAKVEVHVVYDTGGNAYAYFDRPNPYRCI